MENNLKTALVKLKAAEPKLRNQDLAIRLGISEAELIGLSLGKNVIRLEGDWKELLVGIKSMDYVMALTRNEACVHERKGVYDNIKFYGGAHNMGVAINPDIDLRFFMNEWKYAFAVSMERGNGQKLFAFQFFNQYGEAIHKIYTTPKSNLEAYHKLVEQYTAAEQVPLTELPLKSPTKKTDVLKETIDEAAFQTDWKNLKDTHDFHGLLRKYKLYRTQGFRLAPAGYTQKVGNEITVTVLEKAALSETPIMCFVHSPGCIQIHSGKIKNLKYFGHWYNVMDKEFNLHLDMSKVAETWIVKKPTTDGVVTSLELFDENGVLIVYFFGARKPGTPELETWRAITDSVHSSVI